VINEFLSDEPVGAGAALFDVALIARLLQDAAREGRSVSYSEMLMALGYRFTRPKMRSLCKVLDEIDRRGAARGEPELAVLVVRESDRLPGQGWWTGRRDYAGAWEGAEARAYIAQVQARTFAHWSLAKRRG
jgi:hypothetical protein